MSDNQNNPFLELDLMVKEAPPHLKKKVMNDVATAKLIMDMAALFTFNYREALATLFKTQPKKNN